jgi:hypothetical protein
MTARPSPALLLVAAALAGSAAAQTSSSPAPTELSGVTITPPPATPLEGITVTPPSKSPPKVVSTFPKAGDSVAPGALILTVTFDQKMHPDGWDYAKGADRYPNCLARPRLLPDEKTFVLLCTAGPQTRFTIRFNGSQAGGFVNLAGQRATPADLDFTTKEGASLSTIDEAMKAAGLKPDEGPVMDLKPAGALASTAASRPAP